MKEKTRVNQGMEWGDHGSLVAVQVKSICTKRRIGPQATSDQYSPSKLSLDILVSLGCHWCPSDKAGCKENLKMDSRIGLRATTADKDWQQAGLEATPRENRSQHFAPRGTSLSQRASCVWAWAPLRALRQALQESKSSMTGLQDIRATLRTSCRS